MTISQEELLSRLNSYEWNDIEFKEAKKKIPKDAYSSVSAFANTNGGYLVFGVKELEKGYEPVGIQNADQIQNDFITTVRQKDKINVKLDIRENHHTIDGKDILVFYIPEAARKDKPVFLNNTPNRAFLRKGACDVKCTPEELMRMVNDASTDRYDGQIADFDPAKCFSTKDIDWYRKQYESKAGNRSYEEADQLEFLFQLGLIRDTKQGRKPTMASILLFGQDGYLRDILPRPVIDCQRYGFKSGDFTSGERWLDRTICDYNLVQSLRAVLDWYYKFAEIPFEVDPKTMQRKDTPPDYKAFREAIVNILIHQDYNDHTRKAEIFHFTDLTKFWNPGDAFADVEDLLTPGEKEVRNPRIVTAFRRIGFSENAGWGLQDVYKNWRDLGNVPPKINNNKAKKTFELKLRKELLLSEDQIEFQNSIGVHLSRDEATVFAFACNQKEISLLDIRDITGKSFSESQKIADKLITQVLLSGTSQSRFSLSPAMADRFKNHDGPTTDHEGVHDEVHEGVHDDLSNTAKRILLACQKALSGPGILTNLGYKSRTRNFRTAMTDLLEKELIEMTLPDTPRSKNQKYRLTQTGLKLIEKLNNDI
jgi:ATP-dependent DNA helicase RecG